MTDITPTAGDYIKPHKTPWGSFPIRSVKLSTGISSNTIVIGQVVGLDVNSTSFQDCIVPSSLTSNTIVSTAIVGIAMENSTALGNNNAQGTFVPVCEANPMVEFRARTRNGLLNSTIVGQTKSLLWDSTLGITYVNVGGDSATTPVHVVVTGLIDNSGDSGGLVTFKFCARDPQSSLSTATVLAFFK